MFKRLLVCGLLVFLSSCGGVSIQEAQDDGSSEEVSGENLGETADDVTDEDSTESSKNSETGKNKGQGEIYVLFTLNTQHFMDVDASLETLNHVIDLHEEYQIPLDVFLNNSIIEAYQKDNIDIFERLATSDVVAVSYHNRPPNPFSKNAYDSLGFDSMNDDEIEEAAWNYETHAMDWSTAGYTDEPGGYSYLKELIGYAPIITAMQSREEAADILYGVLADMGAQFTVEHSNQAISLGEKAYGLYLRPETEEVRLFENIGEPIDELFEAALAKGKAKDDRYINFKMHDNNFITDASAWTSIYVHKRPPYDLSDYSSVNYLSESEQEAVWESYEEALRYVKEHEEYVPINAFDLVELVN